MIPSISVEEAVERTAGIDQPVAPGTDHQTTPTQFVEGNGISFAYRRFGASSGVPLVFLQHFRGTMDNWDPLVTDGLGASRPIILLDNRGIGRSSGATPDTVAEMASDVVAFVDALGLATIDLLGFSLGGFVAQQILFDRPALVRRAILVGTGGPGAVDVMRDEIVLAATKYPGDAQGLLFLFFDQSPTSQSAGVQYLQRMSARPEREPATTEQTMWAQLAAIRAWAGMRPEAQARLPEVKQKVLVVNGDNDIMIPSANSFSLSQRLPNAELILYPDAGHGSLFQYPEQFVEDAERFLAR